MQEQITSMLFNMAGNKKCHQHLAQKEIIYFITFIFQTKFHIKYTTWAEQTALKKTIKNILHILARLVHHASVSIELVENNIVPIFQRVEMNLDTNQTYAKDLIYINMKLNNSFGHLSTQTHPNDVENNMVQRRNRTVSNDSSEVGEHRLSINNPTSLLESYV